MWSNVAIFHRENNLWFVNFDETKHALSAECQKNGSHDQRFINPAFPHSGNCTVKPICHITSVYTTNPLEPLLQLYIFETKAKKESNYTIDPAWCQGLPTVCGKYGMGKVMIWNSFVTMRPNGGMDAFMLQIFIENVILCCYPGLQKETVHDPTTGHKIIGPLFIKTNTGPDRLSNQLNHIEYHEQ